MVFYRAAGTPPASHSWTGSPACHVAPSSPFSCSPSSRCCRSRAPPTPRRAICRPHRQQRRDRGADWYDDHSVGGDNHLSWSPAGGEVYTNDFGSGVAARAARHRVAVDGHRRPGPEASRSAATRPGPSAGCAPTRRRPARWQAAPAPRAEPATGQFGWFRYVYGRHAERAFNRWHLMDLERSALVPLTAGGVPTRVGQPLGHLPEPRSQRDAQLRGRTAARPALTSASRRPARRSPRSATSTPQTIPHHRRRRTQPRSGLLERPVPDRHHGEPVRAHQGGRRGDRQRALRDGQPHDPARPARPTSASRRSPSPTRAPATCSCRRRSTRC